MPKHKRKATPAQRAKARRDPAIFQPPKPIRTKNPTRVRDLRMTVAGRSYEIGSAVEGQTPWSLGMEQAGSVTLPIRDPKAKLADILTDEELLQRGGARVTIDGVIYCVSAVDHDGEGLYTLTLEDEVAWRLRGFSSYRAADRKRTTRFGFIYGFVREAAASPNPRMNSYIPEVDDKQPTRKPKKGAG